MTQMKIKAVTFDLWDTVIFDDSDEPKRAQMGLPPKPEQRRILVHQYLNRHQPISRELVDTAYRTKDAAYRQVWYGQSVTWTVRERLDVLLKGLGRTLPDPEFAELVRLHEEMELEVKPDLVPGAKEVIEGLHGHYKLGVISDAIFSPGRCLRQLLDHYGILKYFDSLVFSDEVGCSKPARPCFERAAQGLGVDVREIAHIGDREAKDVAGAQAVGARAILLRVAKDWGGSDTTADAVCDDYRQLPSLLDKLNAA
jgi:putative hydrolase of the HAD superfamily